MPFYKLLLLRQALVRWLSQADYSHFLGIARGSLHEVCTQLELAERFGYITVDHETKELTTAIAKSSNYELYGDISRRIIQVVRERAVEIDHDFRTAEINFAPMKQRKVRVEKVLKATACRRGSMVVE